jgi:hypothetical protein
MPADQNDDRDRLIAHDLAFALGFAEAKQFLSSITRSEWLEWKRQWEAKRAEGAA